jgi:hypothetical protein
VSASPFGMASQLIPLRHSYKIQTTILSCLREGDQQITIYGSGIIKRKSPDAGSSLFVNYSHEIFITLSFFVPTLHPPPYYVDLARIPSASIWGNLMFCCHFPPPASSDLGPNLRRSGTSLEVIVLPVVIAPLRDRPPGATTCVNSGIAKLPFVLVAKK